jgi:antitoxin component of RelBE/YafQ-DinJ toxin-antitoxin module
MHRYYLNLESPPSPTPSRALQIGVAVDLALRNFYHGDVDPLWTLQDWYAGVEDALLEDTGLEVGKEWADVFATSERMLVGYMEWLDETGADAGEISVGVELELAALIPGTDVNLHVHIDRLIYDTTWDEWIIDDTKTVDTMTKTEMFEIDDQLLTYAWVVKEALGISVSRLRHTMLRRVKRTGTAKPPFYGREEINVNPARLEVHKTHLQALAWEVSETARELDLYGGNPDNACGHRVAFPSPSRDCSWWCPAYPICVAHDDGSDIQGLRDTLYIRRKDDAA